MQRALRLAAFAVALLTLAGCQTIPKHKVHHRLLAESAPPTGAVIVLPMDIKVKEMSASGLQEVVPAWSQQANENFRKLIAPHAGREVSGLTLQMLPEQAPETQARLEEHLALSHVVTGNALLFSSTLGGSAWQHKSKHFDYTIGPGLSFLADQTGADKALLLIGEDVHSSDGRKAAFIMAAAFGVAIPLGHTVAIATLVDLRTGDVLWMNHYVSSGDVSFTEYSDAEAVFKTLFENYPGLDEYRKFVKGG